MNVKIERSLDAKKGHHGYWCNIGNQKKIIPIISPHKNQAPVPFCQMTQHNLPATEKKVTKGLMNKKVLRRRVRMF